MKTDRDDPTRPHTSAEDLFLFVRGSLAESSSARVVEHARGCAECGARLETVRFLQEQVRSWGRSLFADHLPVEEVVRYSERPGSLPEARRREVERHLDLCRACEADLAMVHAVEEGAPSAITLPGRGWRERLEGLFPLRVLPAWATVALVLLVVPAGVGVRSWLASEDPVRALPAPVRLVESERSDATLPQVSRSDGTLILACEVPVLDEPGVRYEGRLLDASGQVVWKRGELVPSDAFGTFRFLVDTRALDPGPYRVVIVERAPDGTEETYRFSFDLSD